jgi:hypothetical protein
MPQQELPVHFFTIVLNGQPFIRYHLDSFRQLPFRWHWHVVEGVAQLVHDTAWSLQNGGRIDPSLHREGRSNDGTSEYLDEIAAAFPDTVTLYRKLPGVFWDGKREMVAAPLPNIREACLLWQVDSDELWRPEQILTMRRMFSEQPQRSAAFYWCDFFVGPEAVVSTRYNYAQNPKVEWLRTWRFTPGMQWLAHEPPTLAMPDAVGQLRDVAKIAPFTHDETEAVGARFQHFSYVTEAQMRFKEIYYGEKNAIARWRSMNSDLRRALLLRDYFPWVSDLTLVDRAQSVGVVPWVVPEGAEWRFLSSQEIEQRRCERKLPAPQIVLDSTLFATAPAGVNETWSALLKEWWETGFLDHVVLLDRGGMTPRAPGLRFRSIPLASADAEPALLQRVCDEMNATLFVSARNTAPEATPTVHMHGLGGDVPGAAGVRAAAHLVFSAEQKNALLAAVPGTDPATVVVARLRRTSGTEGLPTIEQALRNVAARG